jgi:8-oxo-dGTP diphosphatase
MALRQIRVAAAIMCDAQQRIFIAQRANDDAQGGKWEFPGGKIEPGETPEACLHRELQEELGVATEIHELFTISRHAYPQVAIELLAYRVTLRGGTLTLHTHQAYRWVPLDELSRFDFSAADVPIVAELQSSAPLLR